MTLNDSCWYLFIMIQQFIQLSFPVCLPPSVHHAWMHPSMPPFIHPFVRPSLATPSPALVSLRPAAWNAAFTFAAYDESSASHGKTKPPCCCAGGSWFRLSMHLVLFKHQQCWLTQVHRMKDGQVTEDAMYGELVAKEHRPVGRPAGCASTMSASVTWNSQAST